MAQQSRTWLITGCSSGLCRELALELVDRGENVAATARDPDTLSGIVEAAPQRVVGLSLDVTNKASMEAAVEAVVERFGRIDVLVNNAGFAVIGGVEEVPDELIRSIFETNFFGAVEMIKRVLPLMRVQRSGHILNISSMGGISGGLGMAYYGATKFALAAITELLVQEAAPLGIRATVIEPGSHQTSIVSQARYAPEISDYAQTIGEHRARMREGAELMVGDPRLAVRAMIEAVNSDDPPVHLPLGRDALERLDRKIALLEKNRDDWLDVILSTSRI